MNKKGFITDIVFFGVIIFVIALFFIFGLKWFSSVNDSLQATDMDNSSKEIIQNNVDRYSTVMDGIFIFVALIMVLGIVISIAMLPTHPLFFFVGVVLAVFGLIAVAIIGNSYDSVSTEESISATVDEMPATNWIMDNIVLILAVTVILGFIIMYVGTNR